MTREEIIAECERCKHIREISEECARAIVRLHGGGTPWSLVFQIRGELPPDDDGYPANPSALSGGTKLWRQVFPDYGRLHSMNDRLMADMLGTFLMNRH